MIKSLITKGILNDGDITINKNYELPLDLKIDYFENQINLELQRPIEIEIYCLGGGANK